MWLNVKLQNVNLPAELKLFRQDSVTQIFNLNSADTLLYDEGLLAELNIHNKAAIQATKQNNHTKQSRYANQWTQQATTSVDKPTLLAEQTAAAHLMMLR